MTHQRKQEILTSLCKLKQYCEAENFAGWDPYDGLTSKFFRALPFVGRSAICRLVWIQLFKRNPINLRNIFGIKKTHNAKGIALFLSGYCRLYRAVETDGEMAQSMGSLQAIRQQIEELADLLLSLRSPLQSNGSGWGYNFPWQCRREFLFPADEPTVVATFFAAAALFEAYDVTLNKKYVEAGLAAARFVTDELHRTPSGSGFLFSYSRLPGNDMIINASLLGSALLSLCTRYAGECKEWEELSALSVRACIEAQREDGSWPYGLTRATSWIDSFHTGYNLSALGIFADTFPQYNVKEHIDRGMRYYLSTFFNPDGSTNYYHNRQYPIDIHCPGQLSMTLFQTHKFPDHASMAEEVLLHAIHTMQSPEGYFYYQLKQGINSRIPYMRWSNAFMFCSLSTYILSETIHNNSASDAL